MGIILNCYGIIKLYLQLVNCQMKWTKFKLYIISLCRIITIQIQANKSFGTQYINKTIMHENIKT